MLWRRKHRLRLITTPAAAAVLSLSLLLVCCCCIGVGWAKPIGDPSGGGGDSGGGGGDGGADSGGESGEVVDMSGATASEGAVLRFIISAVSVVPSSPTESNPLQTPNPIPRHLLNTISGDISFRSVSRRIPSPLLTTAGSFNAVLQPVTTPFEYAISGRCMYVCAAAHLCCNLTALYVDAMVMQ